MIENSIFNLRKIFLILGTACNFNCLYCVQQENKPRCKKHIKQEVIDWLDDVAYRLPQKFKPTIHFYGGEPLLYKEGIHQVIDRFGDDFEYIVVSNGSYLTKEDVDYFNTNNVRFILSHDAENTITTRQIDMLEDEEFVKLFNQLNNKGVDAVYSAQTQDLVKVYDYFKSRGIEHISLEDLVTSPMMSDTLTNFNPETLLKSYKVMGDELDSVYRGEASLSFLSDTFNRWVKRACMQLNHPNFGKFPICGVGKHTLAIDTQGNVYLCKNFNVKLGTVSDEYEQLNEKAQVLIKEMRDKTLESKGCFKCPAFYFCRGGCPFEQPSEAQKAKCKMIVARSQSVVSFIDNKMEIIKK